MVDHVPVSSLLAPQYHVAMAEPKMLLKLEVRSAMMKGEVHRRRKCRLVDDEDMMAVEYIVVGISA